MKKNAAIEQTGPSAAGAGDRSPQEIYSLCCEIAQVLLRGFSAGDLLLVEKQVALLRKSLSGAPKRGLGDASGETLLRLEQLDALEGLTEQMEQCLCAIRRAAAAEFERLMGTQSLLRHLTSSGQARRFSTLPVC